MTDDLHARTAAALTEVAEGRALYQTTSADVAVMADAVIAAIFPADWSVDDCRCQLRYTDWTSHG